ncbi:MAG: hypothetical protein QOK28_3620 [Actinomycetota bacterium]|jgi:RimJ/RimL family protein N-acetyltransferase
MEIRPIEPGDAQALIKAHDHLSDESRRLRFFHAHPRMTEAEASFFTEVDHVDREAFVVTDGKYIVAVGRYDRVAPDAAEVAITVGDSYQHHGLGTMLLDALAQRAQQVGITRFVADTFGDNRAAIGLVRHWAPRRTSSLDSGFMHFEMPLSA